MAESTIQHMTGHQTIQETFEHTPYLLEERSVGGVIRATFRIYFEYFWTIIMIFALPVVPFTVLATWAEHQGHTALHLLSLAPSLLLGPIVAGALTIAVADICLGRKPRVSDSYKRSIRKLWAQLLATNLLNALVIVVGLILLVVPGMVFFIWYVLSPSVVVLEGSWGWEALRRSKALVEGYFWHTLGIFTALSMTLFVVGMLTGSIVAFLGIPQLPSQLLLEMISLAAQALIILGTVLTYYDLRVRKEAYDSQTLACDLMH